MSFQRAAVWCECGIDSSSEWASEGKLKRCKSFLKAAVRYNSDVMSCKADVVLDKTSVLSGESGSAFGKSGGVGIMRQAACWLKDSI